MNYTSILCFLLFLISSSSAYGQKSVEQCQASGKKFEQVSRCLDVIKESVDRELQTWINNQIFVLDEFAVTTGRRSPLEMFKRSQQNFNTFRENNCRWQYLAISPAKGAASAYKKCYILLTKNRINELTLLNK